MTPRRLREMVAVMRELGVLEADGIRLGPVPTAPVVLTAEQRKAREAAEERRRVELQYAASGFRPVENA